MKNVSQNKLDILYGVVFGIFVLLAIILMAYGTDAPLNANALTVEHCYQAGWAFVFFSIITLPIWFIHRSKAPRITREKEIDTPKQIQ